MVQMNYSKLLKVTVKTAEIQEHMEMDGMDTMNKETNLGSSLHTPHAAQSSHTVMKTL